LLYGVAENLRNRKQAHYFIEHARESRVKTVPKQHGMSDIPLLWSCFHDPKDKQEQLLPEHYHQPCA